MTVSYDKIKRSSLQAEIDFLLSRCNPSNDSQFTLHNISLNNSDKLERYRNDVTLIAKAVRIKKFVLLPRYCVYILTWSVSFLTMLQSC